MSKIAKVVDVTGCTSVAGMLEKSHTNWDVQVSDAGGDFKRVTRPDLGLPLAYVGDRFRVNNHRNQLHSLEDMVGKGDLIPASVAVWDNGAILAYQFRVPSLEVTIHGQDRVSQLLTMVHSYGSQVADSAFFAGFRAFCKNQFGSMAKLNNGQRVKHRGDVVGKYADILQQRIGEIGGELSGQYEAMRRMTSTRIKGKMLVEYFGEVMGASKEEIDLAWVSEPKLLTGKAARIPDIVECYQVDDGGAPGTVWQAYNAVTRYETHHDGRTEASRTRRMLLGDGERIAHNAFSLAAKMAA